jgi:hypothetical protein
LFSGDDNRGATTGPAGISLQIFRNSLSSIATTKESADEGFEKMRNSYNSLPSGVLNPSKKPRTPMTGVGSYLSLFIVKKN